MPSALSLLIAASNVLSNSHEENSTLCQVTRGWLDIEPPRKYRNVLGVDSVDCRGMPVGG